MKLDTTPLDVKWHFKLDEFIIEPHLHEEEGSPIDVPSFVIKMIIQHHMVPLNEVRKALGIAVIISKKSCFRPVSYEIMKGRNGSSLHTFGTHLLPNMPTEYQMKGACDVTIRDFKRFDDFALLMARSPYKRLIIYPDNGFIHGDYNSDNKNFYVWDDSRNSIRTVRFEEYFDVAKSMMP